MTKHGPKKSQGQKSPNNKRPLKPFPPLKKVITKTAVPQPSVNEYIEPLIRIHRDYRIVLHDVWMDAIQRPGSHITIEQREQFENLLDEQPLACLIRALGLFETRFYNKYGKLLATDGFEGRQWMNMWGNLTVLLACDRGIMDGGTLYRCLECLALNAGFTQEDFQ